MGSVGARERKRRRLWDRASSLESGQSGGVCGSWGASRGATWYWGGQGCPPSSMDPPRRGVVAAAAGGMGRVTVLGGVGPGGPLWRGRGGRGDTVPGTGGMAGTGGLAPGGRWGMRMERSVAAIPFAGAVRAWGVVARWGRVVGSGSGGGGVGGGGGGTAGGGGVGSGGVGVAGIALGPLLGIETLNRWLPFSVPTCRRHRTRCPPLTTLGPGHSRMSYSPFPPMSRSMHHGSPVMPAFRAMK